MILEFFTVFFSSLCGGFFVSKKSFSPTVLHHLLTFSGGYLLSVTLLHLMPTLFVSTTPPTHIGGCVLIGFLLQRFVEMFSAGVEHGHSMAPVSAHCCVTHLSFFPFLISIMVHALLDGTVLAHGHGPHTGSNQSLWVGMILHKFVEAFALMSVLRSFTISVKSRLCYLVLFSLVAPLGFWLSCCANAYMADRVGNTILAIVTGNFLYISATMLFEASPAHRSSKRTICMSLLGAGLAAFVEYFA